MKKTYTVPAATSLLFEPEAHLLLASGDNNSLNMGEASDTGGASESLSGQRIWGDEGNPIWDKE